MAGVGDDLERRRRDHRRESFPECAELGVVLAGEDLPEVLPPGRARRQDGVWKVANSTFCARMVLEDPALADRGVCAR